MTTKWTRSQIDIHMIGHDRYKHVDYNEGKDKHKHMEGRKLTYGHCTNNWMTIKKHEHMDDEKVTDHG